MCDNIPNIFERDHQMSIFKIVTDTTADLPKSFIEESDISVVEISFQLEGKVYGSADMTPVDFYAALRSGAMPSTQQANPYDIEKVCEPLMEQGNDVLYLCFSSGLSGTYGSALIAKSELKEKYPDRKFVVVDSLAASMGEGLLVYYAVKQRESGKTLEETAQWLEDNKLHLCMWFTVNDLFHLHRGGRVSKLSAVLGSVLNIKPVLHVDNAGKLIPMAKARGRKKSIDMLFEKLVATGIDVKDQTVFISHGDCEAEAVALGERIKNELGVKDVWVNFICPTIGTHSGAETIALFFLGTER